MSLPILDTLQLKNKWIVRSISTCMAKHGSTKHPIQDWARWGDNAAKHEQNTSKSTCRVIVAKMAQDWGMNSFSAKFSMASVIRSHHWMSLKLSWIYDDLWKSKGFLLSNVNNPFFFSRNWSSKPNPAGSTPSKTGWNREKGVPMVETGAETDTRCFLWNMLKHVFFMHSVRKASTNHQAEGFPMPNDGHK